MDRWREFYHLRDTNKSVRSIFMVFSKGKLKFFDGFTHSIKKLNKTCTTQLFSSIEFQFLFPIYCLMAPRKLVKRNFMI